jgi:hypothetical protein
MHELRAKVDTATGDTVPPLPPPAKPEPAQGGQVGSPDKAASQPELAPAPRLLPPAQPDGH